VQIALTAGRAVLLPIAVYAWQALGAGYTFRAVKGERISISGRAWPISVGFVALVVNAGDELVNPPLFALGCASLIAALALFEWARRTVRGQFFSWIFSSDIPDFLCTSGPYAYMRNPFYTSYLLTMASTLVMVPSLFRLFVFGGLVIYFDVAARHEERKFAGSALAEEYARYRQRTGRFLPKFSAVRR
jgi:protein-S-isoprenylcysteine O-methyltransferase Ste14